MPNTNQNPKTDVKEERAYLYVSSTGGTLIEQKQNRGTFKMKKVQ